MKMASKSQAINIERSNSREVPAPGTPTFSINSFFGRSMSVASDGTAQNSPPNFGDYFESSYGPGAYRQRTQSFSSNSDDSSWSSPLSTSAPGGGGGPGSWRRSNSVSYANDKNLGRIDEYSYERAPFGSFGTAIMKSREKLFHSSAKKLDEPKGKRIVKDKVVSMLCDSAFR